MVVDSYRRYEGGKEVGKEGGSDILSAHPASFNHNFVSGMQSFYFSKSKGAMVLQTYNEKIVLWTLFAAGTIDIRNSESQDP